MSGRVMIVLLLLAAGGGSAPIQAQEPGAPPQFDHLRHRGLFPTCTACHAGAEDPEQAIWPDSATCAACHDGATRPRVAWRPPAEPRPSNLKFAHDLLPLMTRKTARGEEPLECADCHLPPDGQWMAVRRATPDGCLECHGTGAPHLASPDTLCGTCHLPLARARTLREADVARFPAPPSHGEPRFMSRDGHGRLATGTPEPVASSCTVCHARDFCVTCHVDAPAQAAIQALEPDVRARAIVVRLAAPATHRESGFLGWHGTVARQDARACRTCHTQESCFVCHAPPQRVVAALLPRGADRGAGAQPVRRPPDSHGDNFANRHGSIAAAAPANCAGCHVRPECLDCHRPGAANAPGYHPAGFLTRHPAAAYARETSCGDCHNVGAFCQTCHASAGLVSPGPLGSGYHDASRLFLAGHGQAARQSLESCVGCHVERDCLKCHAARSVGGRGFNPHGPGFNGARLRRKNPEMCTACHGTLIPGG